MLSEFTRLRIWVWVQNSSRVASPFLARLHPPHSGRPVVQALLQMSADRDRRGCGRRSLAAARAAGRSWYWRRRARCSGPYRELACRGRKSNGLVDPSGTARQTREPYAWPGFPARALALIPLEFVPQSLVLPPQPPVRASSSSLDFASHRPPPPRRQDSLLRPMDPVQPCVSRRER